jgi:IS1 family transposase
MESNEFINVFLKKMNALYKYSENDKHTREHILCEQQKIIDWLLSDRSLQQHRLIQSFMSYLFSSYGDAYGCRDDFIDDIKRMVGFCRVRKTETVIQGEKVIFQKYKPKSISFGKCSQKTFNEFSDRLKLLAIKKWGVDFNLWLIENENNLNKG